MLNQQPATSSLFTSNKAGLGDTVLHFFKITFKPLSTLLLVMVGLGLLISNALAQHKVEYQYDELGRLVKSEATNQSKQSYVYDAAGNRITQITSGSGSSGAPPTNPWIPGTSKAVALPMGGVILVEP